MNSDNTIAEQLNALLKRTALFSTLYYNKEKWHTVYPVLSQLAQQYWQLYSQAPLAMQAQWVLHHAKLSYATNLTINQCIITAALCKSQGYDDEISTNLICVSLLDNFCITTQLNKRDNDVPLVLSDKQLWHSRHKLALKILQTEHPSLLIFSSSLSKLQKYKQALLNAPKVMLYDRGVILLSIANIISTNITFKKSSKHIDFYKAISDLYIRTPNIFTQTALQCLIEHIGPILPASLVTYGEKQAVFVCTDQKNRAILVENTSGGKLNWLSLKARLNNNAKQRECNDPRLHFNMWNSQYIPRPIDNKKAAHTEKLVELLTKLKVNHEYTFKSLDVMLKPYPCVVQQLCHAAKFYNKEQQTASNLKHCLSMIGYYNLPAVLQRVIFCELVKSIAHPMHEFFLNRLTSLVDITALIVSKNKALQFEHIVLPLYAYAYYLLTYESTTISRKIVINEQENKTYSAPLGAFFGVSHTLDEHKNKRLTDLLNDNKWMPALLDAEQRSKAELTVDSKLWVCLKIIAQCIYKPTLILSSWQQQTLAQQLKLQGWESQEAFNCAISELNLSDIL
ncbi:hypothetical protein J8L70_09205 [Pseudoalteromonas sp. MMG010]|uniref:hypothetical protein n=1 Tax=Pseudoalteromonas sp. MMG010 TaxID=2822685 RepID=UPI001B39EB3F|nr:hypothetical protein [Pseudoalteromonas sp. MMG010]MBQ4833413.1 hypothetical protein [Pseudoalteromonas sp. MMG010]